MSYLNDVIQSTTMNFLTFKQHIYIFLKIIFQMALKRKHQNEDEFDNIYSVDQPSSSATIQGKVTSLSPIKKGKTCQYFDGELAD